MSLPDEVSNVVPMSTKPASSVVMVTPDMAGRWLQLNTQNRNIRDAKVAQYALDMLEGNWKLTGEAIKFSTTGRLLDGQHRLLAVVEAMTTVPMFVVRGLPDDAQQFMDSGMKRMASDNLRIEGEANATVLAGSARIGVIIDRGLLYRDHKQWSAIGHAHIYQWISQNPDIRRSVDYVTSGEPRKIELRPSVRAYCHYRLACIDSDAADQFFSSLGSLVNLPAGSPVHALSSRLRQLQRNRTKAEMRDLIAMVFRAWNAWRKDRTLTVIPLVPAGGNKTLPEPK